jgi:hypothetical protein
MTLALYIIGSAVTLVLLSARLQAAREELARAQTGHDAADRAARDEYAAYTQGVAVTLACLLAGLAAMHWQAPAARPAGAGQTDAAAGTPGGEAGR